MDGLFNYGTTSLDRVAFRKALDDIGASETAGEFFTLRVLKKYFAGGLQLLAANELTPRLPEPALAIVRKQDAELHAGRLASPSYRAQRALEQALLPMMDPPCAMKNSASAASIPITTRRNSGIMS